MSTAKRPAWATPRTPFPTPQAWLDGLPKGIYPHVRRTAEMIIESGFEWNIEECSNLYAVVQHDLIRRGLSKEDAATYADCTVATVDLLVNDTKSGDGS
jgi:hypothetical protein